MRFDLELLDFVECDIDSDKLAVSGSNRDLSWREFKEEVKKQKKKILSYNLPQGHPIIIYGHKEVEFIVNIVACMSLKMPYIPVDTIYPKERVKKIINITKSALFINSISNEIEFNSTFKETSYSREDQIIYIIFTSGSTGEPKGVQITKSSILNFAIWLRNDFNFSNKNIFMNQAPFSFDLSVYELIGFLLFGGSIILNSRELINNPSYFLKNLQSYKCNTWVSTPSFISRFLLSKDFNSENLKNLTQFIFCGELLPSATVKKILMNFPNKTVINSYGPTEATVATTMVRIDEKVLNQYTKLPVGYVKEGTEIRILNKNEEGIGEIQIIGDNVSIGYFKNEKLNKEKFSIVNGKRAFKTGDYGYFKDEMLFFAERKDDLIKMHGFRIETTEIDNVILKNTAVKDSITIPLKRGNSVIKLITFIVSFEIDLDNLRNKISKELPYYMIPSDIIQLEKLPYNANHKIDKKKLIEIYKGL